MNLGNNNKRLSDLSNGDIGIITKVIGRGAFRKRIVEMGFVKGKPVKVIKNAPLQDPVEYEIMGYNVSLRRSEARLIEVVTAQDILDEAARTQNPEPRTQNPEPQNSEPQNSEQPPFESTLTDDILKTSAREKGQIINIALVGNPNSGKTTLYNYASGSHERVGNYGGVTVDARQASMYQDGYTINLFDLPGTYSITEYTPEELFVRTHIAENLPDLVVNVVDASNLERNLFLTTQLIDMDIKVIIALNMYDELEQKGTRLNYEALGRLMGIPIVPTVAVQGKGIEALMKKVIDVYEDRDPIVRHIHINYGPSIEQAIQKIQDEIWKNREIADLLSTRYLAIKLLENDKTTQGQLQNCPNYERIVTLRDAEMLRLEKEYSENSETIITDAKYGFIAGALKETLKASPEETRKRSTEIDGLLTDKLWGFPFFLFFMWLMFQTTFSVGSYPMGWIESGVKALSHLISHGMNEGPLRDLLIDGIIGGVGGVIVYLPNILILFFFISLMEDTGYMARVSFIMDRLMHKIGLHGKSFIPLLMGFGCNVPGIMATRTLENRKDRLLTMLITPFMSCSARLPVYVLLISAFFPKNQGLVLFSLYFVGVLIAILSAIVMKKTLFAKQDVPFVMELPPYRIPTLRNTSVHMWHKAVQYLQKMGGVILTASILIWALSYYPRNVEYSAPYKAQIAQIQTNPALNQTEKATRITHLELLRESEHQEHSYIGMLGHFIEPVIRPLGYDWKIGVCILTGLAAKEIVVSSMGILYQADHEADKATGSLIAKLQQQVHVSGKLQGQKVFNPLVAYGFMVFVLMYFPCVATLAAIRKESNWKWAAFTMTYTTVLAWIVAFLIYQMGSLFL